MVKTKRFDVKKHGMVRGFLAAIFLGFGILLEVSGFGNVHFGNFFLSQFFFTAGAILLVLFVKMYFYLKDIVYDERT